MNARFPPPPNENEGFVRPSFRLSFLLANGAPERDRRPPRFFFASESDFGGRRIIAEAVSLSLYPSIELTCTYHMRHRLTAPGILGIRDKLSDSYQRTE